MKIKTLTKKLNQIGVISLHTIVPVILVVFAIGGIGAYVVSKSKASIPYLDPAGCAIRGRNWIGATSGNPCGRVCAPGTGTIIVAPNYDYCSGTETSINTMSQPTCATLGRVWLVDGCARRADRISRTNVPQCTSSLATYFISSSSDYCGIVYSLPTDAPKPTLLAPQPEAVGVGANAVTSAIPDTIWNSMVGKSWHSSCPVGRSGLLLMDINYWGFDGRQHRGQLIFKAASKDKYVAAFTQLYNNRIPLHGMNLPDMFGYSAKTNGADDYASMQHDNTSAFNCRWVDGKPGVLSPHSYGTAVDINPYENPYHSALGWVPNIWWANNKVSPYTWRSSTDLVVKIMVGAGFTWTYGTEDAQHFDVN